MTNAVTMITRDATLDDLSAADYRDIYDELRQREPNTDRYAISLDKFVTMITSEYSKALWSQYHNGEKTLNRQQRSELRRAVGLKPLPPTVAEATAQASPDAAVWQVGEGVPEHVIMVTTPHPITLHINGSVTVATESQDMPCNADYRGVEPRKRAQRYIARPSVTEAQYGRFSALGVPWRNVIDAGLSALESKGEA